MGIIVFCRDEKGQDLSSGRGAESLLFLDRPDFFDYPDSDKTRDLRKISLPSNLAGPVRISEKVHRKSQKVMLQIFIKKAKL